MKSYAGIGSRDITDIERQNIILIAKIMAKADWLLYSGNADGSDISFQTGCDGKCVIMLPWAGFNIDEYDYTFSRDYFVLGDDRIGQDSVDKYHPNSSKLKRGGRALMSRNYFQIMGYRKYPTVSLVICCAKPSGKGVIGGTGQAVRIAESLKIPIINIRTAGWKLKFKQYLQKNAIVQI
jgi:hypothetical protein